MAMELSTPVSIVSPPIRPPAAAQPPASLPSTELHEAVRATNEIAPPMSAKRRVERATPWRSTRTSRTAAASKSRTPSFVRRKRRPSCAARSSPRGVSPPGAFGTRRTGRP